MTRVLIALLLLAATWSAGLQAAPVREVTDASGEFTLRVTEVSRTRRFVPETDDRVTLRVVVALETKRRLMSGASDLTLAAAADNAGASLMAPRLPGGGSAEATSARYRGASGAPTWSISLADAEKRATEVAQMKGSVRLAVSTGTEEYRFDAATVGQTIERKGLRVTLRSVKHEGNRLSAVLLADGELPPALKWGCWEPGELRFWVIGSDGKELPESSMVGPEEGAAEEGAAKEFGPRFILPAGFVPKAVALRFVRDEIVDVPFEFRGLPLP